MKNDTVNPLAIPEEFRIACAIYMLTEHEVLQILIDHFTIYNAVTREYYEGYSEASGKISDYVLSRQRMPLGGEAFQSCKNRATELLQEIRNLADLKYANISQIRAESKFYVARLLEIMKPTYTKGNKLILDEGKILVLSSDFIVICELYNVTPKEVLEDFMSSISLAERDARWALRMDILNLAMAFFMKIAYGFGLSLDRKTLISGSDIDFYQRMVEFRLKTYIIRDLNQRIGAMKEFYLTRYNQLKS